LVLSYWLNVHEAIILHYVEDFCLLVALYAVKPFVSIRHLDEIDENLAGFQDFRLVDRVQESLIVALSFLDLLGR